MKRTMQCYKPLWCFKQGCPCARCDDVMAVQQIVCVARKNGQAFPGPIRGLCFCGHVILCSQHDKHDY